MALKNTAITSLKTLPHGPLLAYIWASVVGVGLGVTLFAYLGVQQSLRHGANTPQQQLAEDEAALLATGGSADALNQAVRVDETSSLAPFETIVDRSHRVVASSGGVGNRVPLPPAGSFDEAQREGINTVTWEHDGVRDAAVIIPFSGLHSTGGYVLSARSLRSTEDTLEIVNHWFLVAVAGVILVPSILMVGLLKKKNI